jgi:hypothetical protein
MAATMLSGAILGGAFVVGAFIGLAQSRWTLLGVPVVGVFGAILAFGLIAWVGAYALFRPRLRKISLLRLLAARR